MTTTDSEGSYDLAQVASQLRLESRARSGASWFFFIAGLSLVNSIAQAAGASITFVVGLGFTQLIDGISLALRQDTVQSAWPLISMVNIVLDVVILGVFVGIGFVARRKLKWAYLVGLAMYGLDALLVLLFGDILAAGFHALVIYWIFRGYRALSSLDALPASGRIPASAVQATLAASSDSRASQGGGQTLLFLALLLIAGLLVFLILFLLIS